MTAAYKSLNVLYTSDLSNGSGGFEVYAAIITDVLDVGTQTVELFVMPMIAGDDPHSIVSPRFVQKANITNIVFSTETPGTTLAVGKWGFVIPA